MLSSLEPPYFEPRSFLDEVPTRSTLGFRIIVHGIHSPLQLAVVANPAEQDHCTFIGRSWMVLVMFLAATLGSQLQLDEFTPDPSPTLFELFMVMFPILSLEK